jgi:hypothetical protein
VKLFAILSIPEPYCPIIRCRCKLLAVWREDDGVDRALVNFPCV